MFRRNLSHFLVGCALFFANETHCVGSTSGFATSATHTVVKFAKNSAKTINKWRKMAPKHFYSNSNITEVGYEQCFKCLQNLEVSIIYDRLTTDLWHHQNQPYLLNFTRTCLYRDLFGLSQKPISR